MIDFEKRGPGRDHHEDHLSMRNDLWEHDHVANNR